MASYTTRLASELEKQGGKVRFTKKGLMVTTSYGTATLHNTPSDHRFLQNDAAELKRIGLEHPDVSKPPKRKRSHTAGEYPAYVTSGTTPSFLKQAQRELWEKGWPLEMTTSDLDTGKTVGTKASILYSLGYRWHPEGKKKGKFLLWIAPQNIIDAHKELIRAKREEEEAKVAETPNTHSTITYDPAAAARAGESVAEMARRIRTGVGLPSLDFIKPVGHEGHHHPTRNPEAEEPKAVHEFTPEGAIVKDAGSKVEEVPEVHSEGDFEFIDTRDSWVLAKLPDLTTINSLNNMATAMGLKFEIRVWRDKTGD